MGPVSGRRVICRGGDAGVSQSAFLAGLVAIILAIVTSIVALSPILGGSLIDYILCQLTSGQNSTNPTGNTVSQGGAGAQGPQGTMNHTGQDGANDMASGGRCGKPPPNPAALPPGLGIPQDPAALPFPQEQCRPGPMMPFAPMPLPPVCTMPPGATTIPVQLGGIDPHIVQGLVDDVNGSGSLGDYLGQIQDQYHLPGIPGFPTDIGGHVELTDHGIDIVIPNDEAHTDLVWWVNAAISGAIGIAAGFLAAGLCFASLAPAGAPGLAASVACVAIRGYVTGFVGSMIYQLIDGKSLADPAVWGRSLAAGLIGAIGSGLWEGGLNNFFKNQSGPIFRQVVDSVVNGLQRFSGWLGNGYNAVLEGARNFGQAIADGLPQWIIDAARSAGFPT
jgi:hypothetical protein